MLIILRRSNDESHPHICRGVGPAFVGTRQACVYFTAEKRLSNELDCTTGAEPASCELVVDAG